MAARGAVRLKTADQPGLTALNVPYRRARRAASRQFYRQDKLPLRTRAMIIIGLAALAWLPVIAVGYAVALWI